MLKYLLIILALIYVLSPYDFIPDFFAGWGWLDDLMLVWILWRYLKTVRPTGFDPGSFGYKNRRSFERNRDKGFDDKEGRGADSRFRENNGAKDPYAVLGIEKDASPEEIKTAYKQLANKYHPDKVLHLGDEFKEMAEKRFKEIQQAYQELMNK